MKDADLRAKLVTAREALAELIAYGVAPHIEAGLNAALEAIKEK